MWQTICTIILPYTDAYAAGEFSSSIEAEVQRMMLEKLGRIKDVRVLLYGDFMVDRYISGKVARISPEAPVPVLQVTSKQARLGGAGNVAGNIVGLGAKVRAIGCVGDDPDGGWIISELSESGVETGYMRKHPQAATISKTRLVSKNQQFLRYDEETVRGVPEEYVEYLKENEESIFRGIQAAVISDYGKGAVTGEAARFLISAANRRNIPAVIDPKGSEWDKYGGGYVCTPNVKELGDAAGRLLASEEDILEAGLEIKEKARLKNLVLTRSEKGISLFGSGGGKKDFPAASKDVVDVTGAGDTVACVIALMLACGFSLEDCCTLANIAASVVCSKSGAAALSLNELMEQIASSGEFKLVDAAAARYITAGLREKGKRIVFTNGCFDMLHAGHLASFRQARKFGDVLVAAVNSDASVRRLKGEARPIIGEKDRAAMLCALECVDYVILMEEDTPVNLIKALKPDVAVKGRDWEGRHLPEREAVEAYGGEVRFIDLEGGLSTTNIIRKIKDEQGGFFGQGRDD